MRPNNCPLPVSPPISAFGILGPPLDLGGTLPDVNSGVAMIEEGAAGTSIGYDVSPNFMDLQGKPLLSAPLSGPPEGGGSCMCGLQWWGA